MPVDGMTWKPDVEQMDCIALLERAVSRVERGYTAFEFYKPARWYRPNPRFCMAGALSYSDNGSMEYGRDNFGEWQKAQAYAVAETGGRDLVDFGTSLSPYLWMRVLRAYRRALARARADHRDE
jgi:hypothetical protein